MEPGDEDLFVAASKFMRATNLKLDNDKKLKLYGLYKQVRMYMIVLHLPGIIILR